MAQRRALLMRYRQLSPTGDFTFGQGNSNFLINSPACVAQAVQTRLLLERGEWFLDNQAGTPYKTDILGAHTKGKYDTAIRSRISSTENVTGIESYNSAVVGRKLSVSATINTAFGTAPINANVPF